MSKKCGEHLKQSKITAFCSAGNTENRKRKNAEEVSEVHQVPLKKVAGPDLLKKISDENAPLNVVINNKTNFGFENEFFDDFENDPFLSPKKKESPKKNYLKENLSGNENWPNEKSEICFDTPVKCKILKTAYVSEKGFEQVLLLNDLKLNTKGVCRLRDVWTSFSFSPDDIVSVEAVLSEGHWIVDNKNGFVILNPDIVVSSTTLVSSMFCMRQGILANFFKEIESDSNSKMLIGRFIHELFQEALKSGARTEEELHRIINEIMQSRDNLHDFFFFDMETSVLEREMKNFIPSVKNFCDVYLDGKKEATGKNFNGTIEKVLDIEELIRSPTLGFQGRIDVTVKMRSKKVDRIAPLELKTGRASFSAEHQAQLILYILLMNELGRKVESGLLLYLRENTMEEIYPRRDEIRNLFLLRNHFVGFCKGLGNRSLPEPIRHVKGCMKCSYVRVCTSFVQGEEGDKINESHPIRTINLPDIKPSHVDYFVKWNKMLWLEFQEGFEDNKNEIEVSKLTLEPEIETCLEDFKLNFVRGAETECKTIRPGTFVHIMSEKGVRISTGQVIDVTDTRITVLSDRKPENPTETYKLMVFKSKFHNFYLTNLGWFLNEEFGTLRELIIDKREPAFDENFDKADFREKCLKNLMSLNKEQQKAVLKSLLCQNYVLIKGPPGTGKTQTIVTLVKVLLALNKTVLIASHTHSSIDNILLRLNGVDYLRLGSLKSIHEDVRKNSYAALRKDCASMDDIKKLFDRKVFASTCMGLDANFVRKIRVEFCILDESSQILQPETLRPLFCAKKFVLVGDEDQLPPVVRNPEARKLGMATSLFERLTSESSTVRLRLQYRMNSVINSLANAITYNGLMECANDEVATATMKINNQQDEEEWVNDVLSKDLEKSVVFLDTSELFKNGSFESKQRSSLLEANIIVRLINRLIQLGLKQDNIGVIAPFWDQVTLIKNKFIQEDLPGVELNTVDQYQGRDKEVILFSGTKENKSGGEASEFELLSDERRLTVAVTRAKHKLIILGDKQTLVRYAPFKKLIATLKESQILSLSNGKKNFFWKNFCEEQNK